jgi:hypothetical protein
MSAMGPRSPTGPMRCADVHAEFRWCLAQQNTSPRCQHVLQCESTYPWMEMLRWVGMLVMVFALDRLRMVFHGRRL